MDTNSLQCSTRLRRHAESCHSLGSVTASGLHRACSLADNHCNVALAPLDMTLLGALRHLFQLRIIPPYDQNLVTGINMIPCNKNTSHNRCHVASWLFLRFSVSGAQCADFRPIPDLDSSIIDNALKSPVLLLRPPPSPPCCGAFWSWTFPLPASHLADIKLHHSPVPTIFL